MTRALLSLSDDAPAIADDLRSFGVEVLGEATAVALVREIARQGADLLVAWDAYPTSGLLQALTALREHAPVPVLLFTSDASVPTLNEALRAGIDAYVVNGYERQRLRALVQLARARFERDATVQQAHAELAHRFEERKLVDRAKGILMRARQVPEDEAFKMLRDASMQGHQRVGLVSRRVIDAARDAEAVNRAGQLRMLSQHIVKLAALHQAGVPGAESEHEPWAASVQRVDTNLEHLQRELSPVSFGDLLDAVGQSWQALKQSVRRVSRPGGLAAVDGDAERLLQAADHLVSALEAASPLATLDIVNRAGRLRMLSQRLAKQALLATLLDGEAAQAAAAEAVRTIETFEAVLHDLSRAPLSSPAIQAGLALAQQQWQQMLAGVRGGAGRVGRETIASASERLLECFERLTQEYEQAVQQLFTAK